MFYIYLGTTQKRSGHTAMITDQQSLILMTKNTHASERRLTNNRKPK